MASSVESVYSPFRSLNTRLAVFDREIREQVGQWELPQAIPTEQIISRFQANPEFIHNDKTVIVPLHEPDSAYLTGEYLLYYPDQLVPSVVYHDFANDQPTRISLDELDRSYPAWRLRFWHPDIEPPQRPEYLREESELDSATPTAATTDEPLPDDGDGLLEELETMITEGEIAEREEGRRQCERLPREQFLQTRGGVPELVTAGIERDPHGQQVVRLRLPSSDDVEHAQTTDIDLDEQTDLLEDFGVYPGSEVIVDSLGGLAGFPAEAEVLAVQGRQVELVFYWDRGPENPDPAVFELERENRFMLGELLNPVPFDRKREAVDMISDNERKRGWLSGAGSLAFSEDLDCTISKSQLNNSQYSAAHAALRADDVYCIHGPPGTGKTRTLVEIIHAACQNNQRVLAVSHSNQAVDNLLVGDSAAERADPASLHRVVESSDMTAARAGDNSSNEFVQENYVGNDLYQSDVVCATMSGSHRFGEDIFDLVVIDEATQASIPATLIPLARAERAVLVGDHKQLPPYHTNEFDEDEAMSPSLFEHLVAMYGDDIVARLDTQYRMHRTIATFPNREFYDGLLRHGQKNRSWQISTFPPLEGIHVEGTEQESPSRSYYNELEAEVVAEEVLELLEAGVAAEDIGVITPYSAQIGKIRVELSDLWIEDTDAVKIATVDSFQGSEREAIVVSFVRSNPEGFSGFLTFPSEGPRRLNVALTRARKRCVLVGNFETLRRRAPTKDPGDSSADVYQRLYEFLREEAAFSEAE